MDIIVSQMADRNLRMLNIGQKYALFRVCIATFFILAVALPAFAQAQSNSANVDFDNMSLYETLQALAESGDEDAVKALTLNIDAKPSALTNEHPADPSLIQHNTTLAQYIAGRILFGRGEYTPAFRWLSASAEKRHKLAAILLARLYADGKGTSVDKKLAEYWRDFGIRNPKDDLSGVNAP